MDKEQSLQVSVFYRNACTSRYFQGTQEFHLQGTCTQKGHEFYAQIKRKQGKFKHAQIPLSKEDQHICDCYITQQVVLTHKLS